MFQEEAHNEGSRHKPDPEQGKERGMNSKWRKLPKNFTGGKIGNFQEQRDISYVISPFRDFY